MIKWIVLAIILALLTLFVIKIVKVLLKIEKDSNKKDADKEPKLSTPDEYTPDAPEINTHSSNASVLTDMSAKPSENLDMPKISESGFTDDADDEFLEYSKHMRKKGKRRPTIDFNFEGDMADEDFEYIPDSPDFSYLHNRPKKNKKPTSLNDLPDEIKVLMLSDIFDRKF